MPHAERRVAFCDLALECLLERDTKSTRGGEFQRRAARRGPPEAHERLTPPAFEEREFQARSGGATASTSRARRRASTCGYRADLLVFFPMWLISFGKERPPRQTATPTRRDG